MANSIVLDDVDVATYGYTVKRLSRWLDGPAVERAAFAVPGILAQVPASYVTGALRVITGVLYRPLTATEQRFGARNDLEDILGGEHLFTTPDRLPVQTRVVGAVASVNGVTGNAGWWPQASSVDVEVVFAAFDPISYDREIRVLVTSTARAPIALGTAPVDWTWTMNGPLAAGESVTLRCRSMTGAELGFMTLTAPLAVAGVSAAESLADGEMLELDAYEKTIWRVLSNGLRVSAERWLTDGYWFAPDPRGGNRLHGATGFLSQSSGTGVFSYRPAWAI